MSITQHAAKRMQQRAIPPLIIEMLERFGSAMRCGGAEQLFFDKAARKGLERHLGGPRSLRHVERWLNVYLAIGDNGNLVTVAHRSERFRRH
jgi:hypothetical protein